MEKCYGILFAHGRRIVTTWLRAAGVSYDFQEYDYFLAALGLKTRFVASRLLTLVLRTLPIPDRLLAVIDDTPSRGRSDLAERDADGR